MEILYWNWLFYVIPGGPDALGAYGIEYSADTSEDGVSSDHGMQYSFNNAEVDDMEIYQVDFK